MSEKIFVVSELGEKCYFLPKEHLREGLYEYCLLLVKGLFSEMPSERIEEMANSGADKAFSIIEKKLISH